MNFRQRLLLVNLLLNFVDLPKVKFFFGSLAFWNLANNFAKSKNFKLKSKNYHLRLIIERLEANQNSSLQLFMGCQFESFELLNHLLVKCANHLSPNFKLTYRFLFTFKLDDCSQKNHFSLFFEFRRNSLISSELDSRVWSPSLNYQQLEIA